MTTKWTNKMDGKPIGNKGWMEIKVRKYNNVEREFPYGFQRVLHLLTPRSRVHLEKLTGFQLVKKFPAFYGTGRFITAVTSAHHLSLFWASSIQSMPTHLTSCRPIIILSSHLRLGLSSGLLPSGFPTKTLYKLLPSPMRGHWLENRVIFTHVQI